MIATSHSRTSGDGSPRISPARPRVARSMGPLVRIASSVSHEVVTTQRPDSRSQSIDRPTQPARPWTIGITTSRTYVTPASIEPGFPATVVERAYMPLLLTGAATPRRPRRAADCPRSASRRQRVPERRRPPVSDRLGNPQVRQDDVELGDVDDLQLHGGGELVSQREPLLGR